jgi:cytochrome c oxidase cbb3-type subunit III
MVCSRALLSAMLSSPKSFFVPALVLVAVWAAHALGARAQTQQNSPQKNVRPVSTRGKQTFGSICANCHGLDGRGAERAPNIAENPKLQRLSDSQISHIIENGIPGTGMPAFHSLEATDVKAVVTYLRTLQGAKGTVKLPGDPVRGEAIFVGNAGCSSCHMIAGNGGFIASDLSGYARTHTVEQVRTAITAPAQGGNRQARLVTATIRGGEKVVGRIRNEDNFSLQLQTLDGTFHFVTKSDLEALEYNSQPLMPSDYGSTLNRDELNDLVSYLIKVAAASASGNPKKADEWED